LLTLAFPKYDLGWLGWVALVPFLIFILYQRAVTAFIMGLIFGVVSFSGIFLWIFDIPGYKLLHHVLLGCYFGPLMGLMGLIINVVARRWNAGAAVLATPFIWVSIEYLRSNLAFLALPWALLGHTQYQNPLIIQIASFTGAYGISFLVALANAALTAAILSFSPSGFWPGYQAASPVTRRVAISMMTTVAAALCLILVYGWTVVSQPIGGPAIKTSVLQGNISQEMKSAPKKHAAYIMKKYTDLSRQAAADRPDLIAWPEAATPGFILKNQPMVQKLSAFIAEIKIPLLIGSSEYPKFIKNRPLRPEDVGNAALFFSSEGRFMGQYLKIHLVPFGEELPYKDSIPWPSYIVPKDKKTFEIPGRDYTIFNLGETKFGTVICWEVVFPQLIRQFVKREAAFMVNLTNEGWFGDTSAPHQMVAIVVFRAVENRVPFVRAANTGISCFIDSYGNITGRVKDQNGDDTFVEGYLTGDIRPSGARTFYTRYGDIFVYLVLGITGLILVSIALTRRGRDQLP
jgi:apolipoprotein N-acyltransferase